MAVLLRSSRASRDTARIVIGLAGLAVAVALRVRVAGVVGSQSPRAGLVFALLLVVLAAATAHRDSALTDLAPRRLANLALLGGLGAAVLCVPAAVRHVAFSGVAGTTAGFAPWALVVTIVAVAEEGLLRGSLYGALGTRYGTGTAVAVTSVAFALLHVPVYGWDVLPLDLAVGFWLGALRAVTGSVAVPAVAHAVADLAGWWLR